MPAWAEWPRYRLGALCGLGRLCSGWYCRGRTGLVVVQRWGGTVMKQTRQVLSVRLSAIAFALIASQGAFADNDESGGCVGLPSQAQLKAALVSAAAVETSGLDFQMWATVVDRDGVVCAVAFSGADRSEEHTSELQSHSDLVCRLLLE